MQSFLGTAKCYSEKQIEGCTRGTQCGRAVMEGGSQGCVFGEAAFELNCE